MFKGKDYNIITENIYRTKRIVSRLNRRMLIFRTRDDYKGMKIKLSHRHLCVTEKTILKQFFEFT